MQSSLIPQPFRTYLRRPRDLAILLLWAAALISWSAVAAPNGLTLFVATNGNDNWSGQLAAPNGERNDGPLASVTGARNLIRQGWERQLIKGPVNVHVRGGTYRMTEPFVLEPHDSGSADAPVVYQAYQKERPVLSGGRVLTGWRQNGRFWECTIPEVKAGEWYFHQLFVNGQRRGRARLPNQGYLRVAGTLPSTRDAQGKEVPNKSGFRFKAGDLDAWNRLQDVNLVLMHSWEISIHPLKSVDTTSNIVEFAAPLKEWWTIGYWEKAQRYYVENAFEFLDQPGEWYLHRQTGVLSYYPLPGERLGETEIVAPELKTLVHYAGSVDTGRFVEHVTLQGLAFHHADWSLSPRGNSSTQAAEEVPAAIMADGALHCAIEKCEVAHVGTYGIWFRRGCKDGRIVQNRLFDLGAGGIRVGEASMAKTDAAESSRNLVDNNHLFDGGHVYASGVGIWLAQSSHNRISHNEVHDFLYSGMSIGWNWNDATNRTHHNVIEFNHVHHLVKGVLSDAGAIYTLGTSPGSIIRNNLFHDVWPYQTPPFGWGIYLDATCSGYLVENNIAYNTQSGSLMYNNGGHEHVIQHNIFALSAAHMLWPYFEQRTNIFRRNIIYVTQGELFIPLGEHSLQQRLAAKESLGFWDNNVYWHTGGPENLKFLRRSWAEWQALGLDRHSTIADPKFVNVEENNFQLQPDSVALQMGIANIDTSQIGLYGDPAWVNEARQLKFSKTVLPEPPPPFKSVEIDDGFEDTPVGANPQHAHLSGEKNGASIRVTDKQAFLGKRSLKITDAKDLKPNWEPHFYYEPHLRDSVVRQSFHLRLETNALLFVEWRDQGPYPQNIGPSVTFDGQGRVLVAGKVVATVPVGQWVFYEIKAALGKGAPKTFSLEIVPAMGPAPVLKDLPFAGQSFQELHWCGFSSTAATDAVFYLDNVKIKREIK